MQAVIAGATGLVGREVLRLLLASERYSQVWSLGRRALPDAIRARFVAAGENKLIEVVIDFERLDDMPAEVVADDAFCCLGTTIKKAGSQTGFARVDLDYVGGFARAMRARGAQRFMLVSALGASIDSGVFYNRIKGEAEDAVEALHFMASHVVRPSFLTGDREEFRLGERLGIPLAHALRPLLLGGLKKYRPVPAADVAAILVDAAASDAPGHHIHFCHGA